MFENIGREVLSRVRNDFQSRLDDAAFQERIIGIEKATIALLEAQVDKELIIQLLQKYWDLRLSEAHDCVDFVEKYRM
jgi:hypothetical protein